MLILITIADVYEDYQDIFIDDLDNQDIVLPSAAQVAHQALSLHHFWSVSILFYINYCFGIGPEFVNFHIIEYLFYISRWKSLQP